MQSATSRIQTRVVVSISLDDNHYTTIGTSPSTNLLELVQRAPITIGITVTFMLYNILVF